MIREEFTEISDDDFNYDGILYQINDYLKGEEMPDNRVLHIEFIRTKGDKWEYVLKAIIFIST